jgi:hypothetical protein
MRTYIKSGRINIAVGIMVYGPGVQHDGSILGDELPLVREVLARDVGSPQPEWIATAFDLLRLLVTGWV